MNIKPLLTSRQAVKKFKENPCILKHLVRIFKSWYFVKLFLVTLAGKIVNAYLFSSFFRHS